MKFLISRLSVMSAVFLAAMFVSLGAWANGDPYCNVVFGGDKWEIHDCTVKVDCEAEEEEDEVFCGAEICFDFDGSPPDYEAYYIFVEDSVEVCGGWVFVNLEDANETKYVCHNDAEFTFKVECPPEDSD